MNVASRMEITGAPGAVHCSAATLAALGPDVEAAVAGCFERRCIEVKGLGHTETCLVHAGTPQAAALLAALPEPRLSSESMFRVGSSSSLQLRSPMNRTRLRPSADLEASMQRSVSQIQLWDEEPQAEAAAAAGAA